jgi:hypothetical protein
MVTMSLLVVLLTAALILLVLAFYWLPSILGYYRRQPNLFSVVVVNALLGWTMIGWLVALAKALRTPSHVPAGYRAAPPGMD